MPSGIRSYMTRVPLHVNSKMSKFRTSPMARAAYAAFNGSLNMNGTISS